MPALGSRYVRSALILADIEGVTGIHLKSQCKPGTRAWRRARNLMTADVNAAIEGLLRAQVAEILVRDMHGPGFNLRPECFPKSVRCVQGQFWGPVPLIGRLPAVDCAVMIGWHAAPDQEDGFSPHILHRRIRGVRLKGVPVTEVELFAALLGEQGIPVIFVSAESVACQRVSENLPWVQTMDIPKKALEGQVIREIQTRICDRVFECVRSASDAKLLRLGSHPAEIILPQGSRKWISESGLATFRVLLKESVFRHISPRWGPLLLSIYRGYSRLRLAHRVHIRAHASTCRDD